jgi:hypothetical protein
VSPGLRLSFGCLRCWFWRCGGRCSFGWRGGRLGTCVGIGIGIEGELGLGGFGSDYGSDCCCELHWSVPPGWCRDIVHTSSLDLGGNLASVGSCERTRLTRVASEASQCSCLLRLGLREHRFSCGFAVLRATARILCVFP